MLEIYDAYMDARPIDKLRTQTSAAVTSTPTCPTSRSSECSGRRDAGLPLDSRGIPGFDVTDPRAIQRDSYKEFYEGMGLIGKIGVTFDLQKRTARNPRWATHPSERYRARAGGNP